MSNQIVTQTIEQHVDSNVSQAIELTDEFETLEEAFVAFMQNTRDSLKEDGYTDQEAFEGMNWFVQNSTNKQELRFEIYVGRGTPYSWRIIMATIENIKGELYEIHDTPWSERVAASVEQGFRDFAGEVAKIAEIRAELSELDGQFSMARTAKQNGRKSVGLYPLHTFVGLVSDQWRSIEKRVRYVYCERGNRRADVRSILDQAERVLRDRVR